MFGKEDLRKVRTQNRLEELAGNGNATEKGNAASGSNSSGSDGGPVNSGACGLKLGATKDSRTYLLEKMQKLQEQNTLRKTSSLGGPSRYLRYNICDASGKS